ncbi:MAG: tagaturonate epimerase family protein [Oscillospiraceae bacterium]|nr:tagaturonate epimerase family protein [Oscillospiraceae bacterium]
MTGWTTYPDSLARHCGDVLYMARNGEGKFLAVQGGGEAYETLEGENVSLPGGAEKHCPLSVANAQKLRRLFPFTGPVSHKGKPFTLGLGDRLGIATPGHIRLLRGREVFPVFAQQSVRELTLTGRTFDDVLAAAVWAVFQEGWRDGYGADGDHLKTPEEVQTALDCGFTMITLDCSGQIRAEGGTPEETYGDAVRYAIDIYNRFLRGKEIDFELSLDETAAPTSPEAHLYAAGELKKADVGLVSLAPRFCGEFQKGIDYRGDLRAFEKDLEKHAGIAREMGYKLSIHSGSDKFSVFPAIFEKTGKNVHLKTAGTNWLEALRVIAGAEPALFREIARFALENLPEAKKYYHITENTARIPDLAAADDGALPSLLEQDDARQVLHVTYGLILSAKGADGASLFKDAIYAALLEREDAYYAALGARIGRHLP